MTKQKLQGELDKLKKRIAELERGRTDEQWMPDSGQEYCVVAESGQIDSKTNWTQSITNASAAIGNVFRTREEAELHKLRLESMAKRWKPEDDNNYFYWHIGKGSVDYTLYQPDFHIDAHNYVTGNCHPTSEAAEEWGRKYGAAWKALLDE